MEQKTNVVFKKNWAFAYGGHRVIAYKAGEKAALTKEALDIALADDVAELAPKEGEKKPETAKKAEKNSAETAKKADEKPE